MSNNFKLTLKTSKPVFGSFDTLDYYKDNSTPIGINVTGAKYMKVWINQNETGAKTDPEIPASWTPCEAVNSWVPNFTVEGDNYIHAIFDDGLGNETEQVANSQLVVFDKTLPEVDEVVIAGGVDITSNRTVIVKVTADDETSGVGKTVLSGDLDATSQTEFLWSDADRTAGYKNCTVILSANSGTVRATKTVNAVAVDRAGNSSEQKADTIVLYSGDLDPVIVLKDDETIIGAHYGKTQFDLELQIFTGEASMLSKYKVWGDFNTTEGTDPTPEPSAWQTWGSSKTVKIEDLFFTAIDGDKEVHGKVLKSVSASKGVVATKAELPTNPESGDLYEVTADESKSGANTFYMYTDNWVFYGTKTTVSSTSYAESEIESVSVHHSEAVPAIVLAADKTIISDKEDHNVSTLEATMTTSCDVSEYKVVAYETQAEAMAGTSADATNVDLYGTTPIASGDKWEPELLESKLVTAIAGEGDKFIVVYAKNLCDKWGKSNILTIKVDLTAPTGNITVDSYYNAEKGLTASASDTVSSVAYMTAWVDNNAGTTTPPATASKVAYHANPLVSEVDWSGVVEGDMYAHIQFEDSVGNVGTTHSAKAIYDVTPPTGVSIVTPAETNTPTITANLSASDSLSGVAFVKLYGDVSGAATADVAEWKPYASQVSVTLTDGDGTKTINALFKDNAGNVTETAISSTTKLDTTAPSATVVLYDKDNTTALGTKTNVRDLTVRIGATETITNIKKYKLWGDLVGKTSEPTEWSDFEADSGKNYMSIAAMLSENDGSKTIRVKIQDAAGNDGSASAVITLDQSAPVITVANVDYDTISLVDTPRKDGAGAPISGTKSNKMTFSFSADAKLAEYKVCVFDASKTAESAIAIGDDGGSINMTGNNVEVGDIVNCAIMGADYDEHPVIDAQSSADKIGWVIVVGKTEAGNWSAYNITEAII